MLVVLREVELALACAKGASRFSSRVVPMVICSRFSFVTGACLDGLLIVEEDEDEEADDDRRSSFASSLLSGNREQSGALTIL